MSGVEMELNEEYLEVLPDIKASIKIVVDIFGLNSLSRSKRVLFTPTPKKTKMNKNTVTILGHIRSMVGDIVHHLDDIAYDLKPESRLGIEAIHMEITTNADPSKFPDDNPFIKELNGNTYKAVCSKPIVTKKDGEYTVRLDQKNTEVINALCDLSQGIRYISKNKFKTKDNLCPACEKHLLEESQIICSRCETTPSHGLKITFMPREFRIISPSYGGDIELTHTELKETLEMYNARCNPSDVISLGAVVNGVVKICIGARGHITLGENGPIVRRLCSRCKRAHNSADQWYCDKCTVGGSYYEGEVI